MCVVVCLPFKGGYLDFSHLTKLEKKYMSLKFILKKKKKKYKSLRIKNKKITFFSFFLWGFPLKAT